MNQQQQFVTVDLTHAEGQQLLAWLEDLIEHLPTNLRQQEWLEQIVERVACANAVALWLREEVHVDLDGDETERLLGLQPAVAAQGEWDADEGLGEVAKIRQVLSQAVQRERRRFLQTC